MAKTINEGFTILHGRLTPNKVETDAARSHRKSINDCLVRVFGITNFFRTGSTGSGTSVCNYSDTDYFAVIPSSSMFHNSTMMLNHIKDILKITFPKTNIYVDSPAVVIPFGTLEVENTEVVPAKIVDFKNGNTIYEIPNGYGGWMKSSPLAHNSFINYQDARLSKKAKPLIRFIKAWKYYNSVPLKSFFIEMFIFNYLRSISSIVYSIDIKIIFERLYYSNLVDIEDPTGISGMISPCQYEFQKEDTKSKILSGYTRTKFAREKEEEGNYSDAFYWWNEFFNKKFPSYY